MEDMQNQMNAILGNPEMMQKIMAMAQSLNAPSPEPAPPPEPAGFQMPEMDMAMVQQLAGLAGKTGIDSNQQTLLRALTPYLSSRRIAKLEKAMRAAKMANLASGFLGNSGLFMNFGR